MKTKLSLLFVGLVLIALNACKNDVKLTELKVTGVSINQRLNSIVVGNFTHPGLLHNQVDLDRMRDMVAAHTDPWYSGYQALAADTYSAVTYTATHAIDTVTDANRSGITIDGSVAYQQALMWVCTGNSAYATNVIHQLNSWASTNKAIVATDAQLIAAVNAYKFVQAAEIMRYYGASDM
jgi:hypothetical protein